MLSPMIAILWIIVVSASSIFDSTNIVRHRTLLNLTTGTGMGSPCSVSSVKVREWTAGASAASTNPIVGLFIKNLIDFGAAPGFTVDLKQMREILTGLTKGKCNKICSSTSDLRRRPPSSLYPYKQINGKGEQNTSANQGKTSHLFQNICSPSSIQALNRAPVDSSIQIAHNQIKLLTLLCESIHSESV